MHPRAQVGLRIRGLYGIADAQASDQNPLVMLHQLLQGGCQLVQLRCKGWSDQALYALATRALAACEAVGATLIINDNPWVARQVGAHGVHLGQGDMDTGQARALIGSNAIIGRSTHSLAQAKRAVLACDYLAFGPIHQSAHASPHKSVQGLQAFRAVRAVVPPTHPLVAIGGITATTLPTIRAAGADSWAVIGAIAHATDPVAATRALLS